MKKNYKIIVGIIIGFILSGIIVYADTIISANTVGYNNSNSKLSSTTVQEAIDELYDKTFVKKQIVAYTYNEDTNANNYCISGEEKTCKETKCYETKTAGSCPIGTVVKYYVNDHEYHYFYVLHDDGNTMTMQQRENTIQYVRFIDDSSVASASKILIYLNYVTNSWINVNNQSLVITENSSSLYHNVSVSCSSYNSCINNTYLLNTTARARMITFHEAVDVGCTTNFCPVFMTVYLRWGSHLQSSSSTNTYFTMTTDGNNNVWMVRENLMKNVVNVGGTLEGVRAVVEINKLS